MRGRENHHYNNDTHYHNDHHNHYYHSHHHNHNDDYPGDFLDEHHHNPADHDYGCTVNGHDSTTIDAAKDWPPPRRERGMSQKVHTEEIYNEHQEHVASAIRLYVNKPGTYYIVSEDEVVFAIPDHDEGFWVQEDEGSVGIFLLDEGKEE